MTGQPPWMTLLSLVPSEKRPNQKAAAPLLGQRRRGESLTKKVVAPPAVVSDSQPITVTEWRHLISSDTSRYCDLTGSSPALLCQKGTAQGIQALLEVFLAFCCTFLAQGWLPSKHGKNLHIIGGGLRKRVIIPPVIDSFCACPAYLSCSVLF